MYCQESWDLLHVRIVIWVNRVRIYIYIIAPTAFVQHNEQNNLNKNFLLETTLVTEQVSIKDSNESINTAKENKKTEYTVDSSYWSWNLIRLLKWSRVFLRQQFLLHKWLRDQEATVNSSLPRTVILHRKWDLEYRTNKLTKNGPYCFVHSRNFYISCNNGKYFKSYALSYDNSN